MLAVIGSLCSAAAAAGAALALVRTPDPRFDYYTVLASGSTARFLTLATLGGILGVPAILTSTAHRWLGWIVLTFGAACAALNAALTIPVFIAARALGQPVSFTESLFGTAVKSSIQPELVTFSSGDGWQP